MTKKRNSYFAVVHKDEGSAYGVSFPDFPDCFAAADDQEDLLKNSICALDDYLSDFDNVPEPKSLSDVMKDVSSDLLEGAFLISVPYIHRLTKTVRINISMDKGLVDAIDASADRLDLNRSAYIAQAVKNEMASG